MRKVMKEEEGAVLVIFALTLFVLLFFAGLATDFSMLYMERSDMQNLCKLVRAEEFTRQDEIRFADNPGELMAKQVGALMQENNYDGNVIVYFQEQTIKDKHGIKDVDNHRAYRMRVVLEEDYPYNFMRLFKQTTAHLTAYQDVEATFGDGGNDVIWYPKMKKELYSGKYTVNGAYTTFTPNVFPSDW